MTSYHHVRDHALPPDPHAYRDADPPSGRVIVIAPTRASCETIERALGSQVATLLEQEHGEDIRGLARRRVGFGIEFEVEGRDEPACTAIVNFVYFP